MPHSTFAAVALLIATVACPVLPPAPAQETTRRPNILLLFADDQRPDTIAAFGNENISTPNLDRLAQEGFRFARTYCMGSRHGAVCKPSRAMLMSGRTLHRVRDDLRDVWTLPQALAAVGYKTYATGKWHNGKKSFLRSFQAGRSIMFGGMSDHNKVPLVDLDTRNRSFGAVRPGARHSSEIFADTAIRFLDEHARERKSKPFFLYVAFTAPHDPRDPPKKYRERYYARRPPLPPNFRPQVEWLADETWGRVRDEQLAPWPRTPRVIRDQLAEYYGLITHLDEQVGRVLAALASNGQAERTIVVYAADHGLAVGSHGLLGKQSLFEHSMGCPLIVRGPGIPKGGSSQALAYLFDLYPTLCSLSRAQVPPGVEGQDLVPIMDGRKKTVRSSLFTLYRGTQRAVRDDRWKLIRFPEIDETLLFDLQADPHETKDLSEEPSQRKRVRQMLQLMKDWQDRTGDKQPLVVDKPRPKKVDLSGRKRKPDRWQPEWIRKKYFAEK